MIKAEFHTHTAYSHDSMLNKYFYLFALKIRGINIVAITDHNTIKGAVEYKRFLEKYGIKVIIGEEIFTSEGEIIGLFLSNEIKHSLTPEETVKEIKAQGGLVYIPHPYDEKRYRTVLKESAILRIKDYIDFIEIYNGRNIKTEFAIKQEEIANKYTLPHIIGSDAHTCFELGRNYIIINSFNTPDSLKENIKNAVFVRKNPLKSAHYMTALIKIIKLAIAGKFNEIYRIIKRKFK